MLSVSLSREGIDFSDLEAEGSFNMTFFWSPWMLLEILLLPILVTGFVLLFCRYYPPYKFQQWKLRHNRA